MRKLMITLMIAGLVASSHGGVMTNDGEIGDTNNWDTAVLTTPGEQYTINQNAAHSSNTVTIGSGSLIFVGRSALTPQASLTVTDGTLNLDSSLRLAGADSAAGTLAISGGTVNISDKLEASRYQTNTTSIIDMSGGTLNVTGLMLLGAKNESSHKVTLNYTGGTITGGNQLQLCSASHINFTLGSNPIVCKQLLTQGYPDRPSITVKPTSGYIHTVGETNVLITSTAGTASAGNLLHISNGVTNLMSNGASIIADGFTFTVINNSSMLALVSGPNPTASGANLIKNGAISDLGNWDTNGLTYAVQYNINGQGTVGNGDNVLIGDLSGTQYTVVGGLGGTTTNSAKLTISGGSLTTAGQLRVAPSPNTAGSLVVSGGSLTVTNDLPMSRFNDNAVSALEISGGNVHIIGSLLMGRNGETNRVSSLKYTGGSLIVDDQLQFSEFTPVHFTLGANPIECGTRLPLGGSPMNILLDPGYSHVIGSTNVLILSDTAPDNTDFTVYGTTNTMVDGLSFDVDGKYFTVINTPNTLALVSITGPAIGFGDWISNYALSAPDDEPGADPDGDGQSNLAEYGLGGNPTDSSDKGTLPTSELVEEDGTNVMKYVYVSLANPTSGLDYYLELSEGLTVPSWTNDGYTASTTALDSAWNITTNTIPTDIDTKFIKLIIEEL